MPMIFLSNEENDGHFGHKANYARTKERKKRDREWKWHNRQPKERSKKKKEIPSIKCMFRTFFCFGQ